MTFESFSFAPQVAAGIRTAGYTSPTPIQAQAIPPVMQGRDVMGLAQTGTGKTAAFVLPTLHRLMTGARGQVRAMVIAPTRELAEQIDENIQTLGTHTGLRSATLYGGVSMFGQIQKLKKGVEIVVVCPGRVLAHIQEGNIDLRHLEVLILDEADQMFDMGFFPSIRQILRHVPKERQTLMFSATMPHEIRQMAHDVLRDPVTVQVKSDTPSETVSHALLPIKDSQKTALLLEVLKHTDTESVLIFTRTKHRAKKLDQKLAQNGFKSTSLQGNLSQNRRQEAMQGFRDGSYQIMVATDIAARGIDVSSISHVINYDMPNTPEAYTHRIGRTGRAAKTGDSLTFMTPDDREMVVAIERKIGGKIERKMLPTFDYNSAGEEHRGEFDRPPLQGRGHRGARPAGSSHRSEPPRSHDRRGVGDGSRPSLEPRAARPDQARRDERRTDRPARDSRSDNRGTSRGGFGGRGGSSRSEAPRFDRGSYNSRGLPR